MRDLREGEQRVSNERGDALPASLSLSGLRPRSALAEPIQPVIDVCSFFAGFRCAFRRSTNTARATSLLLISRRVILA